VTGRDRTCDAPRFRRALYRAELRSRVKSAGPESNRRLPPYQRGALPTELPASEWARLGSNQQPLVCKTSALPVELLARGMDREGVEPSNHRPIRRSYHYDAAALPSSQLSGPWNPGQGIEPRPPRSERGVLPVRRSRNDRASLFSMPLAYPSTLDRRVPVARLPRRTSSYVEGRWSPSLVSSVENWQAKAIANSATISSDRRRGSFSLRRGLDSI
jgi:hypothetical protein